MSWTHLRRRLGHAVFQLVAVVTVSFWLVVSLPGGFSAFEGRERICALIGGGAECATPVHSTVEVAAFVVVSAAVLLALGAVVGRVRDDRGATTESLPLR